MYRMASNESKGYIDDNRNYHKPCIEDVAQHLRSTATLAGVIHNNYLSLNEAVVCNSEILKILADAGYYKAHEHISNYSTLESLVVMFRDRVGDAATALDGILMRSLENCTICSSRTNDRNKIHSLMYNALNVVIPELIDHIGVDVIETVKVNTPEQDVPIVAARYLMRIAYLLYSDTAYDSAHDETDGSTAMKKATLDK